MRQRPPGVDTAIIFPERNDSWIVAAASRSYYGDLLAAGVRIFEYTGGLLHTKSLTLDGAMTLIGSANMDRRSFELNFENNILFYDASLTADMRQRQQSYIDRSRPVTEEMVAHWAWQRRSGITPLPCSDPCCECDHSRPTNNLSAPESTGIFYRQVDKYVSLH